MRLWRLRREEAGVVRKLQGSKNRKLASKKGPKRPGESCRVLASWEREGGGAESKGSPILWRRTVATDSMARGILQSGVVRRRKRNGESAKQTRRGRCEGPRVHCLPVCRTRVIFSIVAFACAPSRACRPSSPPTRGNEARGGRHATLSQPTHRTKHLGGTTKQRRHRICIPKFSKIKTHLFRAS